LILKKTVSLNAKKFTGALNLDRVIKEGLLGSLTLESLDLSNTQLTNDLFAFIFKQKFPKLRVLDIRNNPGLTILTSKTIIEFNSALFDAQAGQAIKERCIIYTNISQLDINRLLQEIRKRLRIEVAPSCVAFVCS